MKETKKIKDNILASDLDALKDTHRLVRNDSYDELHCDDWRIRMARRYYNKLYKEFAIIDLSMYKLGKYGLRWRTEAEVISKKGQETCGSKDCNGVDGLATYELPFKYVEDGVTKRELVKICVCCACGDKLQYSKGEVGKSDISSKSRKRETSVESEDRQHKTRKHSHSHV